MTWACARRAGLLTVAAAMWAAMLASPAPGATVRADGTTLLYEAAAGEVNAPVFAAEGDAVTVSDEQAALTPGHGCTTAGAAVRCAGPFERVGATLGDRDDRADASALRFAIWLYGGDGDDELIGGSGDDYAAGDRGDDLLVGGRGGDRLGGGEDDDRLYGDLRDGGPGSPAGTDADELSGGPGHDHLAGGGGEDALDAAEGDDTIDAREPPGSPVHEDDPGCDRRWYDGHILYDPDDPVPCEVAACGAGQDAAFLDDRDRPSRCETVDGVELSHHPPPGGGWGAPIGLTPPQSSSWFGSIGITPLGEALAVWSLEMWDHPQVGRPEAARLHALAAPPAGAPEAPQELTADFASGPYGVATDDRGGALTAWADLGGEVHGAFRAPGIGWTEPVALGRSPSWPEVAMSANGIGAVTWVRETADGTALELAVRSRAGTWAPPVTLADDVPHQSPNTLAVTDDGDVYALWSAPGGRLVFGGRAAGGTALPRETLDEYSGGAQLAIDDDGNAVALWTQTAEEPVLVAERPRGGRFGEPQVPPGATGERGALAVDGSGRKTVVTLTDTVDVSSAPFGEPLGHVTSFRAYGDVSNPAVASSRDGETVVAWRLDEEGHWATAWRSGDGAFGPIEDLAPYCEQRADFVDVAVNDSGRAAAELFFEGERWLSVGTPPQGAPRQRCAWAGFYGTVEPPAPSEEAPPATPTVVAPPPIATPPVPLPQGRARGAAPRIRWLRLRRNGRRLVARVRIFCPARCRVRGSLTLRRRGAIRARAKLARRTFAGARTFPARLRRVRVRALSARRGRRSELGARVVAATADARPVLRAKLPLGRR